MTYYLLLKEFDAEFFSPAQDDRVGAALTDSRFFAVLRMTTRKASASAKANTGILRFALDDGCGG